LRRPRLKIDYIPPYGLLPSRAAERADAKFAEQRRAEGKYDKLSPGFRRQYMSNKVNFSNNLSTLTTPKHSVVRPPGMGRTRRRIPKPVRQQVKRSNRNARTRTRRSKGASSANYVSAPVAAQAQMMTTAPIVSGGPFSGSGKTTVRHREYIGEVNGSVNYAVTSFPVNPGMIQTFPWLARFPAQGYDLYHFKYIRFCYESEKSTASNGSVMLAYDYDASDSSPSNKISIMAYNGAVRSSCWAPISCPASTAMINKVKNRFVRSGSLSANQDIKLYDTANFFIAVQGCADSSVMGELYVEYEVELFSPQLDLASNLLAISAEVTNATVSLTNPLGGTPTITGGIPMVVTSNQIAFTIPNSYLVYVLCAGTVFNNGSSIATIFPSSGTGSRKQFTNTMQNAAATLADAVFVITVKNPGDGFTMDLTSWCTTVNTITFRIAQFSDALA